MSDAKEHTQLTPVGKFRVCNVGDLATKPGVYDPHDLLAIRVGRSTLRDAIQTGGREGEVHNLAAVLDSGALDSDELIIARWPGTDAAIRDRMERLAAALTPDEIPRPVELLQARRNAVMRRDMLARFGYYTAEELADMHGSTAKNRYALATRWGRDGRVFAVPLGTRNVFPAFQFDAHAEPYPVVADTLSALPRGDMSAWGVGLWFYANNAWLPGEARPAELIGGREQELVVSAAQRLSEPEPL